MFKVKNSDVRDVSVSPVALFLERKLPVKTIYWLSRLQREIWEVYKIYNDERIKLNEDACQRDEEKNPIMKDGEYQFDTEAKRRELFVKIDELADLEVEIGIDKIKIPLEQLEGVINAREMALLDPFVEFIVSDSEPQEGPKTEEPKILS